MRNILAVTLFTLALAPGLTRALGLGEIEISSALNQPLRAEIGLLSVRKGEAEEMVVKLASKEAFLRAGVERPAILQQLRFTLRKRADGQFLIAVTSSRPMVEPFLNLLVEVSWPRGRLVREYTLLLDPPVFMAQQAQADATSQAAVTGGAVDNTNPLHKPIVVPTPVKSASQAAPVVQTAGRQTVKPTATTKLTQGVTGAVPAGEYGPVKQGDTLWSIARRSKSGGLTVQQMVIAISRANPDAFLRNNINLLRKGAILRIPQGDTSISHTEAVNAIKQQTALWNSYRDNLQARINQSLQQSKQTTTGGSEQTATGGPDQVSQTPSPKKPSTEGADELKLLAEQSARAQAANAVVAQPAAAADLAGLQTQLSLVNEELEAERLRNEELQSRVDSLEKTVAKMERLISLRESELAALQSKFALAQAAESSPSETVAGQASVANADISPEKTEPVAASSQPTSPASESFIEQLLESPVFLFVGVSLLVLSVVVIFIFVRRRRQDEDMYFYQEEETLDGKLNELDYAEGRFEDKDDFSSGNAHTNSANDNVGNELDVTSSGLPDQELDRVSSVVSEYDVESASNKLASDNKSRTETSTKTTDDAIAEADVYIAYGLFSQAEDLLKLAIKGSPDNIEYQVKLAETYYAAKNKVSFVDLAERLHKLAGDIDSDTRARIIEMGRELDPENILFGVNGSSGSSESELDSISNAPDMGIDFDDEILMENISPDSAGEPAHEDLMELSVDSMETPDEITQPLSVEELDFDFDSDLDTKDFALDNLADESGGLQKTLEASSDPEIETPSADAKQDIINVGNDELLADATIEDPDMTVELSQEFDSTIDNTSSELDGEFGPDEDLGEVDTMLDLAKAYIDMGDTDSAVSTLNEIITMGNDKRTAEAKALLKELS